MLGASLSFFPFFCIKRWDLKFFIFLVLRGIVQYLQKLLLPHNWINRQKYNWVGNLCCPSYRHNTAVFIRSHLFHLADMIFGASNLPCLIQTERWPQICLRAPNCDRWPRRGVKEKRRGKFESDSGRLLEGRRREMSSTLRRRSLGPRTKHAIRAAIHCEVVITRANEHAICPHIKVLANEGLFIIVEHKSSHNPISCLLIPRGRERGSFGRAADKRIQTRLWLRQSHFKTFKNLTTTAKSLPVVPVLLLAASVTVESPNLKRWSKKKKRKKKTPSLNAECFWAQKSR